MNSPRCFRGLNNIADVKEREALLISRLHDCGRSWSSEYPTDEDVLYDMIKNKWIDFISKRRNSSKESWES